MPDEIGHVTNLLNQQEFLRGNQGAPAQDLVGRYIGYHDGDSNIHKASALGNILHLLCPGLFDAPRCVFCFGVLCIENPSEPET